MKGSSYPRQAHICHRLDIVLHRLDTPLMAELNIRWRFERQSVKRISHRKSQIRVLSPPKTGQAAKNGCQFAPTDFLIFLLVKIPYVLFPVRDEHDDLKLHPGPLPASGDEKIVRNATPTSVVLTVKDGRAIEGATDCSCRRNRRIEWRSRNSLLARFYCKIQEALWPFFCLSSDVCT